MVYILFFGVVSLLSYIMVKRKEPPYVCTLIIGTMIALIIGLRASTVGNDTSNYVDMYNRYIIYDNFWTFDGETEIGYVILNRILGLITTNAHYAFIIMAFMMIMPLTYTIFKYSEMPWFSIALVFCLSYFTFFLSGIRQSIVLCLIFAALPWLKKRQIIRFVLLVLILSYIHTSAIFALVLIPFVYIKVHDILVMIVLTIAVLCLLFFDQVLEILAMLLPRYEHYFDGSYFDGTGWLASLFNLSTTIMLTVFIMMFTRTDFNKPQLFAYGIAQEGKKTSYVFEWSIVMTIALQIIGIRANMVDRITSYFSLPWLLYLPHIASRIKEKSYKQFFIVLVILMYVAKFIIVQIMRPEWNNILPYEFFFMQRG